MHSVLFNRVLIINLIMFVLVSDRVAKNFLFVSAEEETLEEVEKVTISESPQAPVEPMLMVKTTLKSFRSMYHYYREEINLGYCWADYFVDINKLIDTLTGARITGGIDNHQSDINSSVFGLLKRWFDNNRGNNEDQELVGVYREENDFEDKKGNYKDSSKLYFDPRIEDKFELDETGRGISDIFISILGLNVPPGLGPLMLGVGSSPGVVIISRIIGTFFRLGKTILETINNNRVLYCTRNYLSVKFYRWIDS